jgi:hypothetical protein
MKVKRLREDELYHHGIKGQRWGIRRYQNPDGTLTAEGRARAKADYSDIYYKDAGGKRKLSNNERFRKAQDSMAKDMENNSHIRRHRESLKPYYVEGGSGRPIVVYNKKLRHKAEKEAKKIYEKYSDEYAKAAIEAHNLDDDPITKSIVKEVLKEDYYRWL